MPDLLGEDKTSSEKCHFEDFTIESELQNGTTVGHMRNDISFQLKVTHPSNLPYEVLFLNTPIENDISFHHSAKEIQMNNI